MWLEMSPHAWHCWKKYQYRNRQNASKLFLVFAALHRWHFVTWNSNWNPKSWSFKGDKNGRLQEVWILLKSTIQCIRLQMKTLIQSRCSVHFAVSFPISLIDFCVCSLFIFSSPWLILISYQWVVLKHLFVLSNRDARQKVCCAYSFPQKTAQ